MNLGLSLKKHGESRLGILMRLWLANRGHFKVGFSSVRQLLGELASRDESLKDIKFDNRLTDIEILIKVLDEAQANRGLRESPKAFGEIYWNGDIRNCPGCAKVGYHCGYFNAPWLSICPIHGEELTMFCPECTEAWPSFSGLRLRTCGSCGVRVSTKTLKKRGAFESDKFKNSIELLEKLFEEEVFETIHSLTECDLYWRGETALPRHNHRSIAYPSFVAEYEQIGERSKIELEKMGVPLFEMESFGARLYLEDKRLLPFKVAKKMMAAIRKKILQRTKSQLLCASRLKHEFRSCYGEYFDRDKGCPNCVTYDTIFKSLSRPDFEFRNELFRYYVYGTYRHIIREPGLVHYSGVGRNMWVLSERFMMLLYEVELWTQIRVLYYKLTKAAALETPPQGMTQLEWGNRYPRIAKSLNSYTFPFFLARDKKHADLYIPKKFMRKEIEVDQDFIDMYFPKEPDWIHEV